jgi:FkbM family methyltransferase
MIINEENLGNYVVPEDAKGVCVDIGANIGGFLQQYNNKFDIIYAYEPIKVLYEKILKYNIKNVIIYNEAVADKICETEVVLHFNEESGSSSIKRTVDDVIEHKEWTSSVVNKVNTIDIEEVIKRTNSEEIDYMKIDCENSEYLILLKKDLSKIKYIGIEVHHQMGKTKWDELKNWVSKTHDGFPEFSGTNKEVLLTNRNYDLSSSLH